MADMSEKVLIVGGGIAGLASGLALARAQADVQIWERLPALAEVGAGVQLGPNVTRILHAWDLSSTVQRLAAYPARLHARSAISGDVLATLPLSTMAMQYGAPYITILRADLQNLLFQKGQALGVDVQCGMHVQSLSAHEALTHANAVVIADGVWSTLRQQLLGDGPPRTTGHLAYRVVVAQSDLPAHLRSQDVTVWMGPNVHVVQYPVRGGEELNVVCLTEGHMQSAAWQDLQGWNLSKTPPATQADLRKALTGACTHLQALIDACSDWRLWPLYDRPPMRSAQQHAQGPMALVGDAAHPMRPYLAQGAGMALEDAAELARQWTALADQAVSQRFAAFAQARWERNARVQARAIRNGEIFHAKGPMQWARDVGLRTLGARLMDMPWLYGGSR